MNELISDYSNLIVVLEILYFTGIVLLAAKIIMDTKNVSKTLAYLLLIIFLPILGVFIYFLFGVNYRKNKFYRFKVERNEKLYKRLRNTISGFHQKIMYALPPELKQYQNTINFLFKSSNSPITDGNHVEVLTNGEEKFPKVINVLNQAKEHIHIEYYIFESDAIGHKITDLLIKKAKQGLTVRFLYDDFGSRKLSKNLKREMQSAGVQIAPVNEIKFKLLANRVNYRDHRKIIVVDGHHVFSGGINIADRYINPNPKQFWRDTHLYLRGNAAYYFQYLFLTNWIFANKQNLTNLQDYFKSSEEVFGDKYVQVAASGPDVKPSIMLSTTSTIYEAKQRIYISTPYFIPVESILNALKSQALSGIDVRLLVPKSGDSVLVNAAAFSYYEELLKNQVKIYFYEKGFVHAKTLLVDDCFSSIGSANMDVRSQDLNFEVNTHIYDKSINKKLTEQFLKDLSHSSQITYKDWLKRPKIKVFGEHIARLFSPLL